MNIAVELELDPALVSQIQQRIYDHNMDVTGDRAYRPLNVLLRDDEGTVKGGALADLWGGWMHLNFLWVAEEVRGQGYGTRLLKATEAEARRAGCRGAYLETHSFQARPFYERRGYVVLATLDDYPPGHAYYFMRKLLE